jgi:hypothetical protein
MHTQRIGYYILTTSKAKANNNNQIMDMGEDIYRYANMAPLLPCKLNKPKTQAQISCENKYEKEVAQDTCKVDTY